VMMMMMVMAMVVVMAEVTRDACDENGDGG